MNLSAMGCCQGDIGVLKRKAVFGDGDAFLLWDVEWGLVVVKLHASIGFYQADVSTYQRMFLSSVRPTLVN